MPIQLVNTSGLADVAHGLLIAALIILFLYLAGSIVEPLAIAALLSFILAPVMRRLRTWGAPKVVAAIFCVGLTLSVIGFLAYRWMTRGERTKGTTEALTGIAGV